MSAALEAIKARYTSGAAAPAPAASGAREKAKKRRAAVAAHTLTRVVDEDDDAAPRPAAQAGSSWDDDGIALPLDDVLQAPADDGPLIVNADMLTAAQAQAVQRAAAACAWTVVPAEDVEAHSGDRSTGGRGQQGGDARAGVKRPREDASESVRTRVADASPPRRSWPEQGSGPHQRDDLRYPQGSARAAASQPLAMPSGDASPPRRRRHDSDDEAPRAVAGRAADASPPRRRRHDSDDEAPRAVAGRGTDASPPRRRRHDSDDEAPRAVAGRTTDASPPRRRRHDGDDEAPRAVAGRAADASPPRRRRHDGDDEAPRAVAGRGTDASPPRRRRHDTDDEAPRAVAGRGTDASPPRRRRHDSDDEAARAVAGRGTDASPPRHRDQRGADAPKMDRVTERETSGRHQGAAGDSSRPVYRDKYGRRIDIKEEHERKQVEHAQREKARAAELYDWRTGAVQKQQALEAAAELAKAAAAPFARYADDAEREELLRGRMRGDDPMAAHVRPSREPTSAHGAPAGRAYRGPPGPPNRYNILPGYRWDGVDRGNGWEQKLLAARNARAARKANEYAHNVADL